MELLESDSVGEDSNHSQRKYWRAQRKMTTVQMPVIELCRDGNGIAPNWEILDSILSDPSNDAQGKHL